MGKYAATAMFSAVVTAVLVSAFWIWFYNFVSRAPGASASADSAYSHTT